MTFLIRRAQSAEDKEAIAELQDRLFLTHAPNPHDGYWWMVFHFENAKISWGDKPIAFGGMEHSRYYKKSGYMNSAAVDWIARGQGLQKRLIRRRVAFARQMGWEWVLTDTSPDNYASANSLIGCGFKLFKPWKKWGVRGSLYFGKKL